MVRPCPEEILPSGSCCLPSLWWVIPLQRPLPVCNFHWIQYDNKIGKQVTKIWQNWDNAVQIFSLKSSRLSLKAMSHGCFRQTLCMYYYYYYFLFIFNERYSNLQGVPLTSWQVTIHRFLHLLRLEWPRSLFPSKVWSLNGQFGCCGVICCNAVSRLLSDPNSEPEGGIQIKNCVATLMTKSKTKFFIEFHSSCLESRFSPCHCTLIWGDSNKHFLLKLLQKWSKPQKVTT